MNGNEGKYYYSIMAIYEPKEFSKIPYTGRELWYDADNTILDAQIHQVKK